jgi:hypothetical protein
LSIFFPFLFFHLCYHLSSTVFFHFLPFPLTHTLVSFSFSCFLVPSFLLLHLLFSIPFLLPPLVLVVSGLELFISFISVWKIKSLVLVV